MYFYPLENTYLSENMDMINWTPQGGLKSRFNAGFSYKSRPEIAWNLCARLIYHAITQFFSI